MSVLQPVPASTRSRAITRPGFDRRASLAEVLDRVLGKGAVVAGEVVISVAGVDLIYLGVNLVLTSVDTARECQAERADACIAARSK
jgi:gas vesicle structural protein